MIITALYLWALLLPHASVPLIIHPASAGVAVVVLVLSAVVRFWVPQGWETRAAILLYSLGVIATGWLVIASGGILSPFIALWMAVSVFAGLFGMQGLGAILALVNIYLVASILSGTIRRDDILMTVIGLELPMFMSYILWRGRETMENAQTSNVSSLHKTLQQESTKSDAVIEAIGDGVIVTDTHGVIQLINPAAQQMTGWTSSDAVGIHYESVLKMENDKGVAVEPSSDPIAQAINTNQQARSHDIIIVTKSGKHITATFVVSPIGDSGEGAIAVFRDVTKERSEEKEQAEFISTASHEMRTPVASIEGYLGLALNPATAQIDDKARDFINKAHESAQHLGHLFQDLLDVTKADDGRMTNTPRVIDTVNFTRDIVDGLSQKASEKGLAITYRPDGSKATVGTTVIAPILYVHVDKDHLREVLANLIENAIKYTPHGEVTVDVGGDDAHVVFAVADSGIGIPAEDIGHLFQKFYRVDNTDTREIGGTGLGLYLCRRLVESMEGRIWVESEHGKGSTFYVELPRIDHLKANDLLAQEQREHDAEAEKLRQERERKAIAEVQTPVQPPAAPQATAPVLPLATQPEPTPAPLPPVSQPAAVAPVFVPSVAPLPNPTTPPTPPVLTTPQIPPIPTPISATPVPQPPLQPAAPLPARPARENTPLSALEQNPTQYTVRRPTTPAISTREQPPQSRNM